MLVSFRFVRFAAFAVLLGTLPIESVAQDKIFGNVDLRPDVSETSSPETAARVLVVMKSPKPGLAPSAAFSNPANYLNDSLGTVASNVSSISDLPVVVAEVTEEALNRLENDPKVAYVLPDIPIALPDLTTTVETLPDLLSAASFYLGEGETIAILDTGVDLQHVAFSGKQVFEACFSTNTSQVYRVESLCPGGTNVSLIPGAGAHCESSIKGCDHGTHVASIALGNSAKHRGIAPAADLMAVQVFTKFTDPDLCAPALECVRSFPSDQLRALKYLADNIEELGLSAVNISLGGDRYQTACDAVSPLTSTVNLLANRGVPVAIASGNDAFFNAVSSPGCVSSAITVTATGPSGEIDIRYANVSGEVDIAARGTRVVGAIPGGSYARKTGTSMATPAVAGLLALMDEIRPSITVGEINQILNRSGDLVSDPRTNTTIPAMNREETIRNIERMNIDLPVATDPVSGTIREQDRLFINSQSIAVASSIGFSFQQRQDIEALFRESLILQDSSGIITIFNPDGFTPLAIDELRNIAGSNSEIFENRAESPLEFGKSGFE